MNHFIRFVACLSLIACLTGTHHSLLAQNALDFDGVDDRVIAPNASPLIANGNISMAGWVYPTNPAAGWPNFDGFFGFRNDANADFYLLQLSSTNVEARFRNSGGTNYDIVYSGLQLNTWNHFVMTYNGSQLKLYHNGMPVDSVAASGVITSNVGFNLGFIPFGANDFLTDGRLDDVGLWNDVLTPAEVSALYTACTLPLGDPSLQLAFQFNQGIAGGNNTGISSLTDSQGNVNGSMTGFTLTGTTSNFILYGNPTITTLNDTATCTYLSPSGNYVWDSTGTYQDTLTNAAGCDSIVTVNLLIDAQANAFTFADSSCGAYTSPSGLYTWTATGIYNDTLQTLAGCDSIVTVDLTVNFPSMATIVDTACISYTSPSGLYTWTTSGIYADTISNLQGCDSLLTLQLEILSVDTGISLNGSTLSASATGATYQWLNCNNNYSLVPGQTNATFLPGVFGSYAVAVTQNGCTDTSACVVVNPVSIEGAFADLPVSVHPNPHADRFTLELPLAFPEVNIRVTDLSGREVLSRSYADSMRFQLEIPGPAGIYLVAVEAEGMRKVLKVVKQEL